MRLNFVVFDDYEKFLTPKILNINNFSNYDILNMPMYMEHILLEPMIFHFKNTAFLFQLFASTVLRRTLLWIPFQKSYECIEEHNY